MSVIWILFLLMILLPFCSRMPFSSSDSDDQSCLTHLHQSFHDPSKNLLNWTSTNFGNPCIGSISFLSGVTCNNDRIYKLSLLDIGLAGFISPFISNCTNLQSLDLSSNSLTGPIPSQISALVNLAVLNLSYNALTGPIPNQISACAFLNVLDLHDNSLSGQIPRELGFLVRLSTLDVSNNRLSGEIPTEIGNRSGNSMLPRLNQTAFEGNKDLYGYPLGDMKGKGISIVGIVGIGLGSGLASLVLSFTAVCVWLKASERKMSAAKEEEKISHLPEY